MVTLHGLFCFVPYSVHLSAYSSCHCIYVEKLQKLQLYDSIGELDIYDLKITNGSVILSSIYLTNAKGQSTVQAIKAAQVDSVDSVGRRQGNQADQVMPSIFSIYLPMEQPLYIIIPSTYRT